MKREEGSQETLRSYWDSLLLGNRKYGSAGHFGIPEIPDILEVKSERCP